MTSISTLRPTTTPTPAPTLPTTTDQQHRTRRLGLLIAGGVSVAALAAGALIWAGAGSEQPAPTSPTTAVVYDNQAAAGALVGHGTTVVSPRIDAPAVSDADAGALVGSTAMLASR